ncbi:hypothetical protein [Cochlodiniinecator piscidefendens]|uniref:hypothetical protein n=1 Tax=Cochlodiniinecator piscidefendens TaxID=2715756 RepID=UPI00197BF2CF|nr:hypothetical protein [Cochlodiniinecator piscidefendens]
MRTAIRLGESSTAILQRVKNFDDEHIFEKEGWNLRAHIGIEPMLLALSMELALKAWYVFDHDTSKAIRSHNLSKLFEALKPESKEKLNSEFKRSVAPFHPDIAINYGIETILFQHANAFVDWRYLHEPLKGGISFNSTVFVATLEMVLCEFNKLYRIEKIQPACSPM